MDDYFLYDNQEGTYPYSPEIFFDKITSLASRAGAYVGNAMTLRKT